MQGSSDRCLAGFYQSNSSRTILFIPEDGRNEPVLRGERSKFRRESAVNHIPASAGKIPSLLVIEKGWRSRQDLKPSYRRKSASGNLNGVEANRFRIVTSG